MCLCASMISPGTLRLILFAENLTLLVFLKAYASKLKGNREKVLAK